MGGTALSGYGRTDRYGIPLLPPSYRDYPANFLRIGPEKYVAGKLGNVDALRLSGITINPSSYFRPGMKPAVEADSFLPRIYKTPVGYEADSVYGSSINTHFSTMLVLEGIHARTGMHGSPFSMEALFHNNLNLPKDAHFGTLTIGEPRMLRGMWDVLAQRPGVRTEYWRERLKDPLLSRLNQPGSLNKWQGFEMLGALAITAEEQKKRILSNMIQEVDNSGLDDATLLFLMRNGLLKFDRIDGKGSDLQLLTQFNEALSTFIRQKAQLQFDKRLYGYRWQDNDQDNLFLNVHMFFGELTGLAARFIIENHGTGQINFCGTTGAVIRDLEIGKPFIPLSFRSGPETLYEGINGVSPLDIREARHGIQMAVPTPLLETWSYLERVRSMNVGDSIDCESVDLARLCSIYPHLLLKIVLMISDNPYQTSDTGKFSYDYRPVLDVFGLPN